MGTKDVTALAVLFTEIRRARRTLDFEALAKLVADAVAIVANLSQMWGVSYSIYYVGEGWDLGAVRSHVRYFVTKADADRFVEYVYETFEEPDGAFLEDEPSVFELDEEQTSWLVKDVIATVNQTGNIFSKADALMAAF